MHIYKHAVADGNVLHLLVFSVKHSECINFVHPLLSISIELEAFTDWWSLFMYISKCMALKNCYCDDPLIKQLSRKNRTFLCNTIWSLLYDNTNIKLIFKFRKKRKLCVIHVQTIPTFIFK